MYVVRPTGPGAKPVFSAKTFRQTVRWCIAAQQAGTLEYDAYDIIGAESSLDDPELMATFEPDRRDASPPPRKTRGAGVRRASPAVQPR
jgi:hypothetical protein